MRIAFALFVLTLLPGIPLASVLFRNIRDGIAWFSIAGVLGLVWSAAITAGLAVVHISLSPVIIVIASVMPFGAVLAYTQTRRTLVRSVRALSFPRSTLLVLLSIGAVLLPFLVVQRGLPTGDIQKALFWGEHILASGQLPSYTDAAAFNRDPADFTTPALHTLTAAVMSLSGDALHGPTWLAFLSGLLLSGIASAFAAVLAPRYQSILPALAFLLAAANARALRYTVAPGYHYQNLFGELFLLLSVFALVHAVGGRGHQRSVLVAIIAAALLPFVHQFSAFLAALTLPIIFLLLVWKYRGEVAAILLHRSPRGRTMILGALLAGIVAALGVAFQTSVVSSAITRLITATPHLRETRIPIDHIPELFGIPFVLLACIGILVALIGMRRQELEWRWILLLAWSGLVLAISQGPAWFLDIPSARTLFYLIAPLALFVALAVVRLIERIRTLWPRAAPLLVPSALALLLALLAGRPLNAALHGFDIPTSGTAVLTDHRHHHNATLTPAMMEVVDFLEKHPPECDVSSRSCPNAILVDDWNYRRGTWAILSPYRMLVRVGADISIHAGEAKQSAQRRTQYKALLDFERVMENGSSPTIQPLLKTHGVAFILTRRGPEAEALKKNPLLQSVLTTSEATLFRVRENHTTRN